MRAIFTFTAIAFKCQTAANCLFDSDPTHQATGSEVHTSPLTQPDQYFTDGIWQYICGDGKKNGPETCDFIFPGAFPFAAYQNYFACDKFCENVNSNVEIATNGFLRCSGNYCLKLFLWPSATKCGNDMVDFDEYCDGHIACAIDC